LNYGLADLEWFFQLWMFCIFLFWINTIIHVLPETSIQEITGCANPKIDRKRQSKNLPDFIIQNTKKNKYTVHIGTVLSLRNFVGVQEEKCRGTGRNCPNLFILPTTPISQNLLEIKQEYINILKIRIYKNFLCNLVFIH